MKVIEFVGMPRAGKTTQITRLKTSLESKGHSVTILTDRERAQSLKTPPTEGLAYTLTFFTAVVEAYYTHVNKVDYLLIDRGFNDASVWSEVRYSCHEISQDQRDALKKTFEPFKKLVDRTFYFKVSIDIGLTRHERTEHQAVDEVAMNKKWLALLEEAYEKNYQSFTNVIIVNGNEEIGRVEAHIRNLVN